MRRICLLLLVLLGCEETGLDLPLVDAGTPDAGTKACLPPSSTFTADVPDAERPTMIDYEGPVVVRSVTPLILAETSTTGERWRITVRGNVWDDGVVHIGDVFDGRIRIRVPFWSEVDVALADPSSGELALMFWNRSSVPRAFAGISPLYVATDCTFDQCGLQKTRRLTVSDGSGSVALEAFESGALGNLAVFNGLSSQFIGEPECTDNPSEWLSGWIARPTTP